MVNVAIREQLANVAIRGDLNDVAIRARQEVNQFLCTLCNAKIKRQTKIIPFVSRMGKKYKREIFQANIQVCLGCERNKRK